MKKSGHLVARQTIELLGIDRSVCEALAARTSSIADMLALAVERSLDRVDTAGLRLLIDRVELDLGSCDPARWEEALTDGIREGLAAKVAQAIHSDRHTGANPKSAALLLLSQFARSGRLPWWCPTDETPSSAMAMLVTQECEPAEVHAVLAIAGAIDRFVNQLGEPDLEFLLQLARPGLGPEAAAMMVAEFAGPQPGETPRTSAANGDRASRLAVWRAMLLEAANDFAPHPESARVSSEPPGTDAELQRFRDGVARRLGVNVTPRETRVAPVVSTRTSGDRAAMETDLNGYKTVGAKPDDGSGSDLAVRLQTMALEYPSWAAVLNRLASLAPELDARSIAAADEVAERQPAAARLAGFIDIFTRAGLVSSADAGRAGENPASTYASEDAHDSITVPTSGLVLAWPFLPLFFDDLGFLDGKCFNDVRAQHRAAAILHYVATGEMTCPEQELPLAKVLAGIDLDLVHEPGEPLGEVELECADALLQTILDHAPMLGKISPGGLREAFLTRPGLLSTRDGHWLLRVERRSFDILLDRLPWSFAWVKLPWMSDPLQVEW